MMKVRTRFAPSPTGYLHIGGARTALFNYLYAKKQGGEFLLRVEDTDLSRSTKEAKEAILKSMEWLDLKFDEDITYQSERRERHLEVANQLLTDGKAYYCFTDQDEIAKLREEARSKGEHFIFKSPWRDAPSDEYPKDVKPVIRLKAPREGETVVKDLLQGDVVVQNSHLDDMILVRSDGMPTYMLAVVVDDHDMGITHIIRGDDHLSNAPRQQLIYMAMDWDIPHMVHIPLIHGPDGAKLSKRHGALGAENYREMGYLPDALNNYLLRLGWSHGDDEIISREQAIEWFDIPGLGKSPSRLDFDKMKNLNAQYLRKCDDSILAEMIFEHYKGELSKDSQNAISKAIESMKPRAELVTDLYELAKMFIVDKPLAISEDARQIISESDESLMRQVIGGIGEIEEFSKDNIQAALKEIAKNNDLKLGGLMKYVRAYVAGQTASPSVFEMIAILGKEKTISRLEIND
ncbi:MAG: glutamate--tRNA ligase [Pseudomonadota bacterium]